MSELGNHCRTSVSTEVSRSGLGFNRMTLAAVLTMGNRRARAEREEQLGGYCNNIGRDHSGLDQSEVRGMLKRERTGPTGLS